MIATERRWNRRWIRDGLIVSCFAVALALILMVAGEFEATVSPKSGIGIPTSAVAKLTLIAKQQAVLNRDANPTIALVVETTYGTALTVISSEGSMPQSAPESVYLIMMVGNFIGSRVSTSPRPSTSVSSYLSVIVDAHTFRVIDESLNRTPPLVPLSSLGPGTTLAVGRSSG